MSEKLAAVIDGTHVFASAPTGPVRCDLRTRDGDLIPVAIVPVPEGGEVREMWRWKDDTSRNYTAEEMTRVIAGIDGCGAQRSDFHRVTVIDREVRE